MARQSRIKKRRSGGALVELVVCLPILFSIVMGTVEACRMIFVRQSARIAAYECARFAITPGIVAEDVQDLGNVLLAGRRLSGFQVTLEPENPASLSYGDLLTATVAISADDNALGGNWFYKDTVFRESVTIMAEY